MVIQQISKLTDVGLVTGSGLGMANAKRDLDINYLLKTMDREIKTELDYWFPDVDFLHINGVGKFKYEGDNRYSYFDGEKTAYINAGTQYPYIQIVRESGIVFSDYGNFLQVVKAVYKLVVNTFRGEVVSIMYFPAPVIVPTDILKLTESDYIRIGSREYGKSKLFFSTKVNDSYSYTLLYSNYKEEDLDNLAYVVDLRIKEDYK